MNKIREILLTEYIGAILVALLVADAFVEIVSVLLRISYRTFFAGEWERYQGLSNTYSILTALVKIALYLLMAYLLARWLYPAGPTENQGTEPKQD